MKPKPRKDTARAEAMLGEITRIDKARRSLAGFVEYVVGHKPADHHRLMCADIDALLADEFDFLLLCQPPGSGKSTYTSRILPSYFLGRFPGEPIICASNTAELSIEWGKATRNLIGEPEISTVFPDLAIAPDSRAVDNFKTTTGGEMFSIGVGGTVMGRRAKLILVDDPLKGFEEASSATQLAKLHSWFETDLITRLKPGGKVIIVSQRLARNDLVGYLQDRNSIEETYRVRERIIKMECEEGDIDPLGRKPGETLWPEWFTPVQVADAKRDDFRWRCLYQQRPPSDTGEWVSRDEIRLVDSAPTPMTTYLCTDLSLNQGDGDWTVHLAVGIDIPGRLYVLDAWRIRTGDPNDIAIQHLRMIDIHHPVESLIEDDILQKHYRHILADRAREAGTPVPLKVLPIGGKDKVTRAAGLRALFKQKRVFIVRAEWNSWLVRELLHFPHATGAGVDDGVDALGLIGRRLAALSKPAAPAAPKPIDPRGSFYTATLNDLWDAHEAGHIKFGQGRI
jgi:predicted phage terminase large subunit-like protein